MPRLARLFCVWIGVAVAVWLIPASIHIVDWGAAGPSRIALFAPLWQLWIALAVAVVAVLATSVRGGVTDGVRDTLMPLGLLWLWAIPFLPWIPDRAPVLLALAGPLRWAILALAIVGCVWLSLAPRVTAFTVPGRRTVFAVSVALYLGFGLWSAAVVGPGADEPHYLVITQSLLRDHDLAIENNHTRGDYHEYYGGELRPDFLRRGLDEVIYSIHAPGLPAILVPAYAAGGYTATVVVLCLFASLAALAVFDLALVLTGPVTAWLTWAAVCLTVPFIPHAWLIFPEMPGALLMAWAALWLYLPLPDRARTWIWRGLALAVLPWLHTKFVILLAAMIGALCLRVWRNPKAAAALVVPAAVASSLWIFLFYRLYGELDPQAPYGDFPKLFVLAANIPRGVLGLLFDQKFGLLIYAPVYLVALPGAWLIWRRADLRWFAAALLATIGAFVGSSTRMFMWWGGSSAPARFLVPILPLAAPLIAVAFHDLRSRAARATAALLLVISVAVAIGASAWPEHLMLFSPPHGVSRIVDAVQGGAPLALALPSFTQEEMREPVVLLLPWLLAGLAAVGVLFVTRNRKSGTGLHAAALLTFVLVGAVAARPTSAAGRRDTARQGRFDLMHAYDAHALRAYSYARRSKLDEIAVHEWTAVSLARSSGEISDDAVHLAGPMALPAGRYTARIWFGSEQVLDGGAFVSIGGVRIAAAPLASNPASLSFDMPVDADAWIGLSDPRLARIVQKVELTTNAIVPRRDQPVVAARVIEAISARPGAFLVYTGPQTYPEGGVFWTRGKDTASVYVSTGGASTLALTLHIGPRGGAVRLSVDGQDRSLTLEPNSTRQIEIPVRPDHTMVQVIVAASTEFRPADHEPGSTDRRRLGVQVRVDLR